MAGGIGALSSLKSIGGASALPAMPTSWTVAVWFPIIAHLVLGIAFVAAGIRLKAALATDPTWIKRMLVMSGAVLVVEIALTLFVQSSVESTDEIVVRAAFAGAAIGSVIGLAITAYLYASVHRLWKESRSRVTQTVFE